MVLFPLSVVLRGFPRLSREMWRSFHGGDMFLRVLYPDSKGLRGTLFRITTICPEVVERPFDRPFDRLKVPSMVEGLTVLSKVEGHQVYAGSEADLQTMSS
jgi:hypothetical protein